MNMETPASTSGCKNSQVHGVFECGECITKTTTASDLLCLEGILPAGYRHIICSMNKLSDTAFDAEVTVPFHMTEAEVGDWKDALEDKSGSTFCVRDRKLGKGYTFVLKKTFYCKHGCRARASAKKTPSKKQTNCISQITVIVHSEQFVKSPLSRHSQTLIKLKWSHNHPLGTMWSFSKRNVGSAAKSHLTDCFQMNMSRPEAKASLFDETKGSLQNVDIYDRKKLPDRRAIEHIYQTTMTGKYGNLSGALSKSEIKSRLKKFADEHNILMQAAPGDQLVIAFITPLMMRVHKMIKQSSELVFLDSTGTVERYGTKVFLLMCHSPVGGLPLGIFLAESESPDAIHSGLECVKSILPKDSFFGRGEQGPSAFMTDNSDSEREALARSFPSARRLLCIFHMLQQVWRWLWSRESGVSKDDRPQLLVLFMRFIYAKSENDFNLAHTEMLEDVVVEDNPKFIDYLDKNVFSKKADWSLAFRNDILTRGQDTNNVVEAGFRRLKDQVLKRKKAFNTVHLAHQVTTEMDIVYVQSITDRIRANNPSRKASIKAMEKGRNFPRGDRGT